MSQAIMQRGQNAGAASALMAAVHVHHNCRAIAAPSTRRTISLVWAPRQAELAPRYGAPPQHARWCCLQHGRQAPRPSSGLPDEDHAVSGLPGAVSAEPLFGLRPPARGSSPLRYLAHLDPNTPSAPHRDSHPTAMHPPFPPALQAAACTGVQAVCQPGQ